MTTSDVTELSTDGWFSDKLVDFCVRSLDDTTPCCASSLCLPDCHMFIRALGIKEFVVTYQ